MCMCGDAVYTERSGVRQEGLMCHMAREGTSAKRIRIENQKETEQDWGKQVRNCGQNQWLSVGKGNKGLPACISL